MCEGLRKHVAGLTQHWGREGRAGWLPVITYGTVRACSSQQNVRWRTMDTDVGRLSMHFMWLLSSLQ